MKDSFRDKTAIITGASSGIGKALALQLSDEGAWVALASRDEERLLKLISSGLLDRLVISMILRPTVTRMSQPKS